MSATGDLVPPALRTLPPRPRVLRGVPAGALVLLALTVVGLLLAAVERPTEALAPTTAAAPTPALTTLGVGAIPVLGDPVRDLTVWYSDRVADANRAALRNLQGQLLTPIDPLTDAVTRTLYGPMVLITLPLLTFGGLVLGFLVMTSRTSGENAYAVRSITPRFVVATMLAILGIFLASVLAQFTSALDGAMIGVSLPAGSVGNPTTWPSAGGVFAVLAHGGFDPSVGQGPDNWNDGAWQPRAAAGDRRTPMPRRLRLAGDRSGHDRLAPGPGGRARGALRLDDHLRPVQHRGAPAPRSVGGPTHRGGHGRPAGPGGRGRGDDAGAAARADPGRARGAAGPRAP